MPHAFERALETSELELALRLACVGAVPWADFFLNPRRLRGSDFLMRWSQGMWSEERVKHALQETGSFFAMPYGPSGVAPDDDVQAFERYFERLEKAGLGKLKRPDLLVFKTSDEIQVKSVIQLLGGIQELPFTPEDNKHMVALLRRAVVGIECENSLWRASQMPDYAAPLKPQKRLRGRPGLRKSAVLPTVILKEEDRVPLLQWQRDRGIKLHIWHVFYDMAFGISLDEATRLIRRGAIQPTKQVYQAPGGATTTKVIYKIYHHYAYFLGKAETEPTLVPDYVADKNGHILPYVRFKGGSLKLTADIPGLLKTLAEQAASAQSSLK